MTFTYTFSYFLTTVSCSLIAITILVQININLGSEQQVNAFRNYLSWYLVFVLSNMIWVWINYGYVRISGMPFSMINLIAICLTSYYWFKFIETKLSVDFVKNSLFRTISLIPLTIALALILSTPFTKQVFYYNSNNEYIHGPLYSTMFVLALSYLLFATGHIATKLKYINSKNERAEFVVLALFLLFPVAAGLLDIVAENLPIMELSLLFGTILVYTQLLRSQISNDNLTGLNNRRAVDEYISEHIASATDDSPLYVYMLDIDEFKSINDRYGHIEGDRALKTVGRAMQRYYEESHHYVARWGGDEFCIAVFGEELDNPKNVVEDLQHMIDEEAKKEGLEYELKLSAGYAKCRSSLGSMEKIIDAADKMLYENKETNSAKRREMRATEKTA